MKSWQLRSSISLILIAVLFIACSSPRIENNEPTIHVEVQTIKPTHTATLPPALPAEPADIIFHHGIIITIEKAEPMAEAVAIRRNVIQAVGSNSEVLNLQGPNTIMVDLQGKTILPGFIDNHTHYLRNGLDSGIPLREMMDNFLSYGYTAETEMVSIDEFIDTMLTAEADGEVPIRLNIYAEYNCGFLEDGQSIECISWYKDHDPILDPDRMVRIPGVKIFADGDGSPRRGCPYYSFDFPSTVMDVWPDVWDACKKPHGNLYLDETQLTAVVQDIQKRGYRAAFHAMGDASIETILNALETVLDGESNLIYRHEILHGSMLSPQLIDRIVRMDILTQFGGMFNVSEADWYRQVFGEGYYEWAAARYALPGLGAHVSFGNDYNSRGDIKNLNPFRGLYGYVTHKEVLQDGTVVEPPEWVSRYEISVARALEIMTIEGAYALSMEEYTGSILPGKFADLIVISDNPLVIDPNRLIDIQVLLTMVNGEMKYCAPGQEAYCPLIDQTKKAIPTGTATVPVITEDDSPQTVQVKYDCNKKDYSPASYGSQIFLLTYLRWAASTEKQVDDFLQAVQPVIYLNGKQIQTSMDHDMVEQSEDKTMYIVRTYFDVGKLQPGNYDIRTVLNFNEKIFDGTEYFGPGTPNATIEGYCSVIIE